MRHKDFQDKDFSDEQQYFVWSQKIALQGQPDADTLEQLDERPKTMTASVPGTEYWLP